MINHDRLFKELITTFFQEFLELFRPEMARYLEPDSVEFLDKEVFTDVTVGESRETDILVKCKVRGQESYFLVHIEHQSYSEADFNKRMFRYFARLSEKFDVPIYPIAILSYQYPQSVETNIYEVRFPQKLVMHFEYDIIQLNRLNWRDFLEHPNPVASALMAKMKIAPKEHRIVKLECLRMLANLRLNPARSKLISGFIDTYLRLNAEENQQLMAALSMLPPNEQEGVMEIVTSWTEEGIAQGITQGIAQGIQQEANALISRLLRRRLGEVNPVLGQQIVNLPLVQLEDLAEALLDFSSSTDLENWLQQLSPKSSDNN